MNDTVVAVIDRQLNAYNQKDAQAWANTYSINAVQQTTDVRLSRQAERQFRLLLPSAFKSQISKPS